MAPKRKRSAPLPPAIADSPPSATSPPKKVAPPPHKEEEEEDGSSQALRSSTSPSTTTNPLLLLPPKSEPEEDGEVKPPASSKSEDGMVKPPASSIPLLLPPKTEESEEGEEDEEMEALEWNPASKQQPEGKGGKPPVSSKGKNPITRKWSKDDKVRILQALAAHRRGNGMLPNIVDLEATLAGSLDRKNYSLNSLTRKINNLKSSYNNYVSKGQEPSKKSDLQVYHLSKEVWGDMPANLMSAAQLCELYPHFAEQIQKLEETHGHLFNRDSVMLSEEEAREFDDGFKKLKLKESKAELLHLEFKKEVLETLANLIDN